MVDLNISGPFTADDVKRTIENELNAPERRRAERLIIAPPSDRPNLSDAVVYSLNLLKKSSSDGPEVDERLCRYYALLLEELEGADVWGAAKAWAKNSTRFPLPAELRRAAENYHRLHNVSSQASKS